MSVEGVVPLGVVALNITIMALPPKCPELNPVENVWQFLVSPRGILLNIHTANDRPARLDRWLRKDCSSGYQTFHFHPLL
jgi:hypothetical protein